MKTITLAPGEELRVVCIAPNGTKTKIEVDDEHVVHVSTYAKTLAVMPQSATGVRISTVEWPS